MSIHHIIYLHGFASSGGGTKGVFFQQQFAALPPTAVAYHALDFNPTPRDFEFMTITGMINRLRQFILALPDGPVSLIGSSMGGLVAVNYAHRFGGVAKLLLLSPALRYLERLRTESETAVWQEKGAVDVFHFAFERMLPLRYAFERDGRAYRHPPPPSAPTRILHGRADEIVPIESSRAYAQQYPSLVTLTELDAGHDVNAHLDVIWTAVTGFLLGER